MNIDTIAEGRWINAVEGQQLSGLLNNRILKRKITGVNIKELVDLVEVLRLRVSVTNPDDGKQYYSVADPMVNAVVQPGIWRGGIIETTDGVHNPGRAEPGGTITQTLSFGWIKSAEALPTPILLTDDQALLSPFAHDITSFKNTYVWEYRWIDPDYAVTLRNTITAKAFGAGVVWNGASTYNKFDRVYVTTASVTKYYVSLQDENTGQTPSGVSDTWWSLLGVISAKIVKETEGYCNIQVFTQTNTWNGTLSQVWEKQTQNPTFAAEKIINTYSHVSLDNLESFKTTLGTPTSGYKVSSINDATDEDRGFAKIIQTQDKLFPSAVTANNGTRTEDEILQMMTSGVVRTTLWLGVADSALDAAITTLSIPPDGYTVLKVGHNYNGTGSADVIRVMITKGDATAEQLRMDFPTFEGEKRTYFYFGLDKTTASSKYITCQTVADSGFKVDNVSIIEWHTALAVVQQISKIMLVPAEGLGHTISTDYEWWGDGEVITKKWLAIKDADLAATIVTLSTPPSGYSIASIGHNFNGTGSADIVRVVVKQNTVGFESAIEFPTFEGERKTNIYLGFNAIAAASQYTTCQTPPAGYKVDSVTKQQGSRGTITVIQQISKVQSGSTSAVRRQDYTRAFGLVTMATTIYLNVPKADIATVKAAILVIANIIVLTIDDNDNGRGSVDITYTWRTKEAAPRSVGDISISKAHQFAGQTNERVWIDVNLISQTALADAVALALAGTAPYTLAADEQIIGATGQDAGDKTGHITQRIFKKPSAYTYASYSEQQSINPHGLREAVMALSVREYPEIAYADLGTIFTSLQTFLGTPQKGQIKVSFNKDKGTFDMLGIKEGTPDWDNTTPTYVQTTIRNHGQIDESKHEIATGVPIASAAAIVDAATADSGYALDEIRMTERGAGEAVIEKEQTKAYGTVINEYVQAPYWNIRGIKRAIWPKVLTADLETTWTTAATYNVGVDGAYTYQLKYRQRSYRGNGLWDVINEVEDNTIRFQQYHSIAAIQGDHNETRIEIEPFDDDGTKKFYPIIVTRAYAYDTSELSAKNAITNGNWDSSWNFAGYYTGTPYWFSIKVIRVYQTAETYTTANLNIWLNYTPP